MVRIRTENLNQTSFYPFVPHDISVLVEFILGHLRYLLTDVPPQPNSPPDNVLRPDRPTEASLGSKRRDFYPASDSRSNLGSPREVLDPRASRKPSRTLMDRPSRPRRSSQVSRPCQIIRPFQMMGPSSEHRYSPSQLLKGHEPDVSHIKTFGCAACSHSNPSQKIKVGRLCTLEGSSQSASLRLTVVCKGLYPPLCGIIIQGGPNGASAERT
ncbi:unnamed protein product [Brassica oleracea]